MRVYIYVMLNIMFSSCKSTDENINPHESELSYTVWQDFAINPPILPKKIVEISNQVHKYKTSSEEFDLLIIYSYPREFYNLLSSENKGTKVISKSQNEIQFTQLDFNKKINIVPSSDKYWKLFHNPDFLGLKIVSKKDKKIIGSYAFTGKVDQNKFIKNTLGEIMESR